MVIAWVVSPLFLLFQEPPCGPLSAPNALCQPSASLPAPEIAGTPAPFFAVEVVLEDGGKPGSRPEIRYFGCDARQGGSPMDPGPCRAFITLKGFREVQTPLNSHGHNIVVLPRLGAEGDVGTRNAVSVSQLAIPAGAHRAYAKGEAAAGLERWSEAESLFRQTVALAPSMALAWDELGWALERQNKPGEARDAYQRAIAAQPDLVRPYVHLAGLSILAHNWDGAAALTGQALRLQPVNFPRAYFYDAMAHLNLQHLNQAEASARQTIALDHGHAFPVAEYILGAILLAKNDAAGASQHLQTYIDLEPRGPYAAFARQSLTKLEGPASSESRKP